MRLSYWGDHSRYYPGWPACVEGLKVPLGVVRLRPIRISDGRAWSQIRRADRDFLEPWEIGSEIDWVTRYSPWRWIPLCWGMRAEAKAGRMLPFTIELNGRFCGQLTVGNIIRGALRSAWIGYWVHSAVTGHGVATAALALGVDHCFTAAGLHRIEATVRPENDPSKAVLVKAGFRQEGFLHHYLYVDGAWRDHLLFAITNEDVQGSVAGTLVDHGYACWI